MNPRSVVIAWTAWVISGLLVLGCSTGGTDSNTNFLERCERDSDCGRGLACWCQRCTRTCASDADCSGFEDAVCSTEGAQCLNGPAGAVCTRSAPDASGSSADGGGSGDGGGDGGSGAFERIDPTGDPTAPWRSGQRLRARVVDGGDGAAQFIGWYDTALEQECRFAIRGDGTGYCLPDLRTPDIVFYRDPGCSDAPLLVSFTAGYAGELVQVGGSNPTEGALRCEGAQAAELGAVYRVGAAISIQVPVYAGDGSGCTEQPLPPGATLEPMARVPFDTFVAGRLFEASGDMGARWISAADGAYETRTLLTTSGGQCDLFEGPDSEPLCLPVDVVEVYRDNRYRDASCTEPFVFTEAGPCTGNLAMAPTRECPAQRAGWGIATSFYEFVQSSWTVLYESNPFTGACDAYPGNNVQDVTLGATVPASSFAVPSTNARGTGRLQARFGRAADGRLVRNHAGRWERTDHWRRAYWFYDTETREICHPTLTVSGERCLPADGSLDSDARIYIDATCTTPAVRLFSEDCLDFSDFSRTEGGAYAFVPAPGASELSVASLLRPLPVAPTSTWYERLDATRCEPIDGRVTNSQVVAAEVIPVDAYAPITRKIE